MIYEVQAWVVPAEDDEEPCEQELHDMEQFTDRMEALSWAWDRMEEGFFVRLFRR